VFDLRFIIRLHLIVNHDPDLISVVRTAGGWIQLELVFESFFDARNRILGFGRGVEVLAPRALQRSVLDYAEQVIALYNR
jgi:predicted DNA-binding transcriptional regulator YafY